MIKSLKPKKIKNRSILPIQKSPNNQNQGPIQSTNTKLYHLQQQANDYLKTFSEFDNKPVTTSIHSFNTQQDICAWNFIKQATNKGQSLQSTKAIKCKSIKVAPKIKPNPHLKTISIAEAVWKNSIEPKNESKWCQTMEMKKNEKSKEKSIQKSRMTEYQRSKMLTKLMDNDHNNLLKRIFRDKNLFDQQIFDERKSINLNRPKTSYTKQVRSRQSIHQKYQIFADHTMHSLALKNMKIMTKPEPKQRFTNILLFSSKNPLVKNLFKQSCEVTKRYV